jgi:hypothetical protein
VGYESDTVWLTQTVSNTSDALYAQCLLYKFVTSPLETQRVHVPPAAGQVSRAFASNAVWLSRDLDCSCSVGGRVISVVAAADGSISAAAHAQALGADVECAVKQQMTAVGICRQVLFVLVIYVAV